MNYLSKEKIPKNKLPIYFCDAVLIIQEVKRNKKTTFELEFPKVVLKGISESDLKNRMIQKAKKPQFNLFTKTQLKYNKIIGVNISIRKFLSFGILE